MRDGTLDTLLVRPAPVLAQVAADRFALRRLGRITQGLLVLGYALVVVDVDWTAAKVLMMPVMVVSGAAIFASVFVAGAAFQFVAQDAAEVQNAFTYGGTTLLQYPPTVFAKDLVRGVTFVLPLAFVNWVPALYVLGRPYPLDLPEWVGVRCRRWWRWSAARSRGSPGARVFVRTGARGVSRTWTRRRTSATPMTTPTTSFDLDRVEKVFDVRKKTGFMRSERRQVRAVDSISFTVARGEMVGYIGPNGAGKSTTIKMLTGILTPSGGRLRVAGIDPSRERTRLAQRIGVVFGQRTTLWWDLPLIDSYRLMHRMYRIPDARYAENLDRCVELLELGELLDVPVRQLSLGQRMRGDIAAALLHDPEVLYLDEPTIGLDVISKAKVREFLRDLNAEQRHDRPADHPRPDRHRAAVPARDGHRPRASDVRRSAGRAARDR